MKQLPLTFLLLCMLSTCVFSQNCVDPSLIDPNVICTTIFDPVCGCDGVTYPNSCEAEAVGGVTSWVLGACTTNNCLPNHYIGSTVHTGLYESTIQTRSDGFIPSGNTVIFESETEICLEPNFETDNNVDFTAQIAPCNDGNLCIGDCSNTNNILETFYLYNGGTFQIWLKPNLALCQSSAVNIDVQINGSSIHNQIHDLYDATASPLSPFMLNFTAPPNATISIDISLVLTTVVPNQGISCFVLGDAYFGYSF